MPAPPTMTLRRDVLPASPSNPRLSRALRLRIALAMLSLSHRMNEAHFYWQAVPDQDDLMKVISFTKKSVHNSRRAEARIFYYFNNFIQAPHVLDNFGKDLLALGLCQVYLGYLSSKGQSHVFYVGDTVQDVILAEMREHLKKMPKPKLESTLTKAIAPSRSTGKPARTMRQGEHCESNAQSKSPR